MTVRSQTACTAYHASYLNIACIYQRSQVQHPQSTCCHRARSSLAVKTGCHPAGSINPLACERHQLLDIRLCLSLQTEALLILHCSKFRSPWHQMLTRLFLCLPKRVLAIVWPIVSLCLSSLLEVSLYLPSIVNISDVFMHQLHVNSKLCQAIPPLEALRL